MDLRSVLTVQMRALSLGPRSYSCFPYDGCVILHMHIVYARRILPMTRWDYFHFPAMLCIHLLFVVVVATAPLPASTSSSQSPPGSWY